MATNRKQSVKLFRVFVCPAIFKIYVINHKGKTLKNKHTQQAFWGIFVGIPDDSAGWLFFVPDARGTAVGPVVIPQLIK